MHIKHIHLRKARPCASHDAVSRNHLDSPTPFMHCEWYRRAIHLGMDADVQDWLPCCAERMDHEGRRCPRNGILPATPTQEQQEGSVQHTWCPQHVCALTSLAVASMPVPKAQRCCVDVIYTKLRMSSQHRAAVLMLPTLSCFCQDVTMLH